ncbi:MAG: hypothetical protein KAX57_11475 [Rhodoferax sp.]|jgi:hypothetical protein|nr:hypothetical protein [Rhodoferax sp.]
MRQAGAAGKSTPRSNTLHPFGQLHLFKSGPIIFVFSMTSDYFMAQRGFALKHDHLTYARSPHCHPMRQFAAVF